MFSIFKRRSKGLTIIDMSGLGADMHSHLIPGIDDGAEDVDMSIKLIKGMHALGFRKLITTPHVMWEMYKNTNETILNGFRLVQERLKNENIPVEFSAAAEYYMDDHFDDQLEKDMPLLTIKDNMVLVEFSFIREPIEVKELLFKLQIKGYQPIIAHPERYLYFGAHKNWYDEMKEAGCLFQLNFLSLCGYYGKKQEELAQYLIKKKYVELLGSDLHNARHLEIFKVSHEIMDNVHALLDAGVLLNPQL
jgi:tyrosine-protein phosphatase YwqE